MVFIWLSLVVRRSWSWSSLCRQSSVVTYFLRGKWKSWVSCRCYQRKYLSINLIFWGHIRIGLVQIFGYGSMLIRIDVEFKDDSVHGLIVSFSHRRQLPSISISDSLNCAWRDCSMRLLHQRGHACSQCRLAIHASLLIWQIQGWMRSWPSSIVALVCRCLAVMSLWGKRISINTVAFIEIKHKL
jgi:hypothetical protein